MEFKNFYLKESINDSHIFKAIFVAGGMGSGKSFISSKMFGGTGAKYINSDIPFEYLLDKYGLTKKIDPNNKELYKKQMELRSRAKEIASEASIHYIDGMLPLIIDGTGKNYEKIKTQKETLEALGYDTYMVFVNTSLDTSLERNKTRERSLSSQEAKKAWLDVQSNIGKFQSIFSNSFVVIDNSKDLKGKDLLDFEQTLTRKSLKFLDSNLHNRLGLKILKDLRDIKGKYVSDLGRTKKPLKI